MTRRDAERLCKRLQGRMGVYEGNAVVTSENGVTKVELRFFLKGDVT